MVIWITIIFKDRQSRLPIERIAIKKNLPNIVMWWSLFKFLAIWIDYWLPNATLDLINACLILAGGFFTLWEWGEGMVMEFK